MEAEPGQGLSASISNQSHADEKTIDVCEALLSSGHSFSEILAALKRLGARDAVDSPDLGGRAIHRIGMPEIAANAAVPDARPLEPHSRTGPGALVVDDAEPDAARSLLVLPNPPSMFAASAAKRKSSPLFAGVFFGLVPAVALLVIGIAGKLLIDADLHWKKVATGFQTDKAALSAPTPEAARTAPAITPGQFEPAHATEPIVAGSSTPLAAGAFMTAPVRVQHSGSGYARIAIRPRLIQIRRQWGIPRRLTDGL